MNGRVFALLQKHIDLLHCQCFLCVDIPDMVGCALYFLRQIDTNCRIHSDHFHFDSIPHGNIYHCLSFYLSICYNSGILFKEAGLWGYQQMLRMIILRKQLLKQKKLKRARVIQDSGLEKAYVYQIFKGEKKPSRDKLIALAFGLHLNIEETQRMLKLGGCSELYARTKRDALILFCIFRKKSIYDTDAALYKWGLTTLLPQDD